MCAVLVERRSARRSSFGVPVSEIDTINFGFRIEHTELIAVRQQSAGLLSSSSSDFGYVTNSYIVSGGWSRDTRNDILYPTFGRLQSGAGRGRPAVRRPCRTTSCSTCNQSFWPVYRGLRADAARRISAMAMATPASRCRSSRRSTRAASARCAATRHGIARSARHLRQHAGRQAQDRRQCRAVLSDAEGRQVGARQRYSPMPARST